MSKELESQHNYLRQQDIDTGRNRQFNSRQERQEHTIRSLFLENVKNIYELSNIYYPGCGIDTSLEPAFDALEITYMDKRVKRTDAKGRGIKGDFTRPPFENYSFDSVYIRDLHLHKIGEDGVNPRIKLNNILNTVKNDGILIYGISDKCSEPQDELPFVAKNKNLKEVSLSFENPEFRVFQVQREE